MIGRGTILCKELFWPAKDKQCFYIFDYLGNCEFFRQNPQGIELRDAQSVTEAIFSKKVRLVHHLQHAAFAAEEYQNWRNDFNWRNRIFDKTKQQRIMELVSEVKENTIRVVG